MAPAARRLVALLHLLSLALTAGAADDGEARALLALGAALDPSGRLLPSWAPGRGDPCVAFEGVACDARGAVANVSLQGKGLAGALSPAVAGLPALTGLYLHYNRLRGGVPRELAGLANLTDLYLNVNNLTGPIPPEIGAMASLQGDLTSFLLLCRMRGERDLRCARVVNLHLGVDALSSSWKLQLVPGCGRLHVAAPWTLARGLLHCAPRIDERFHSFFKFG